MRRWVDRRETGRRDFYFKCPVMFFYVMVLTFYDSSNC